MAARKDTQEGDAISRLADAGEDALRRLVDFPRRTFVEALEQLEEQLREAASKLRAIDPLYRRVAAIEKRLELLEQPPRRSTRRRPTRATSAGGGKTSAAKPIEPPPSERDVDPQVEVPVEGAPEPEVAKPMDEGTQAQ